MVSGIYYAGSYTVEGMEKKLSLTSAANPSISDSL